MDDRKGLVEIDLSEIQTSIEVHKILKEKLGFPSYYGMNWDTFWDSITGLVEMPHDLKIMALRYTPWGKLHYSLLIERFDMEPLRA